MGTEYTGDLLKMRVALEAGDERVRYWLRLRQGEELVELPLTERLGEPVRLQYTGTIHCSSCGRVTKKSFQGFCYPCFRDAPEASPCIIRPELCEAHLGKGRDPAWEAEHHNRPHLVYLALTSAVKVGVTRDDQIPTRWIGQGAWRAIVLAETPQRQLAGRIEVACKDHVTDKTPWQRMLKDERATDVDLVARKADLVARLPPELQVYASPDNEIREIPYPVTEPPKKVKSQTLDRVPDLQGRLTGIRGQYLLLDEGRVFNVRRHTGYEVRVTV